MSIIPRSVPPKKLAQSILSTDSTFSLNNILDWDGVTDLTSSDFGTVGYGVFKNSTNTVIEIFQFDPSTIADSAITINLRGLKPNGDLTTEVTAYKQSWNANETTVMLGTDVPQLLNNFVDISRDQTIAGKKTFSEIPSASANGVDDDDLVTMAQLNAAVIGSAAANRIVVSGTAGATLVAGNLVYLDTADGEWKLTDADTAATVDNVLLGIAQGAGTDGGAITNGVLIRGYDNNQTGLTGNLILYASNTAGGIVESTPGTTEVTVGTSLSATEIYFSPRFNQHITEDQQDALAGTYGTPSLSNKFVTDSDPRFFYDFGDGSDGDVTISSGTTTLTRDMYYNNLTLETGAKLATAGFVIHVAGTLTREGTGYIDNSGGDGGNGGDYSGGSYEVGGTAGSAGAATPEGTLPASSAGKAGKAGGTGTTGAGGNGVDGEAGSAVTNGIGQASNSGSAGGAGGAGSSGAAGTAGAGGAAGSFTAALLKPVTLFLMKLYAYFVSGTMTQFSVNGQNGGAGSGSAGGGNGSSKGGGGGGSGGNGGDGGPICVYAKTLVLNNSNDFIVAKGGDGGDGGDGAPAPGTNLGAGGGGASGNGGNGGYIGLHYLETDTSPTLNVSGGSPGAIGAGGAIASGLNAGADGTIGTAGVDGVTVTIT